MAEKIVALLGGDRRELLVAPALLEAGFALRTFGHSDNGRGLESDSRQYA